MKYKCTICSYIYDENGIDPVTGEKNVPWSELPEEWVCPKCNAPKSEFKPMDDEEVFSSGEVSTNEDNDYDEEQDLNNF